MPEGGSRPAGGYRLVRASVILAGVVNLPVSARSINRSTITLSIAGGRSRFTLIPIKNFVDHDMLLLAWQNYQAPAGEATILLLATARRAAILYAETIAKHCRRRTLREFVPKMKRSMLRAAKTRPVEVCSGT